MNLPQMQAAFWRYISGASPALPSALLDTVHSTPGVPAQRRLEIYRNMYVWRLMEALRHDFPGAVRVAGDDRFAELAMAYLRARPSCDPDIGQVGAAFPAFLKAHDRALAALAAFEQTRRRVFTAAPADPVDVTVLQSVPPENVANVCFDLIPALALVEAEHDAAALWEKLESASELREEAFAEVSTGSYSWAVWRAGHRVMHARLTPAEATCLRAAQDGATLAQLCAVFADYESPTQAAFAVLGSWFADGWIRHIALQN